MSIEVTHQGPVSIITLDKAPMNLLDVAAMDRLIEAHQEADQNSESRVILTRSNIPGMFSNGLNPMAVIKADLQGRAAIFDGVARMFFNLLNLNKPHIAHINGPAMAGGAILALTADIRLMDREHGRLCFSEPKVGLPIPGAISQTIAHFCHPKFLREVVLLGKNMDAEYAFECGMADYLVSEGDAQAFIETMVSKLARLSPKVLAATKKGLRGHLINAAKDFVENPGEFEPFLGDDFIGEGLKALVEGRKPNYVQ